jgi:poly-gamma-glutamate synthesis protein (capsule biosynthesis protein)
MNTPTHDDPIDADPSLRSSFAAPRRPPEIEMRIGIAGPFSLALAGDCIASRPIAGLRDRLPGFAAVMDLLHQADVCCGNLETSIVDIGAFAGHPYCWDGDWPLLSEPGVGNDLAALGFDMFARANNHALDWGLEGMRETTLRLDAAGLVHAGAGENLGLARRAAHFEAPQGRIGLVAVATTYRPTSEALRPLGATPGRPGVSALRLRQIDILTDDEMKLLRGLRPDGSVEEAGAFSLFGRHFETGAARGYRHEMDPHDLMDFLRNVRQGKQGSDFLVVMVHSHETGRDGYPEPPSPFLKQLARAAIDAGADTICVSGIHHLGPVDLYRGRPIFYGLGNFIWSDLQEFLPSELFDLNRGLMNDAFAAPHKATAADLNGVINARHFAQQEVFETILPIVKFDGPALMEIVLHPIDLGRGDPLTLSGVPRLAEGEQADRILRRIRDASAAFGCEHEMQIVDGTGILRATPA